MYKVQCFMGLFLSFFLRGFHPERDDQAINKRFLKYEISFILKLRLLTLFVWSCLCHFLERSQEEIPSVPSGACPPVCISNFGSDLTKRDTPDKSFLEATIWVYFKSVSFWKLDDHAFSLLFLQVRLEVREVESCK